MTARLRAAAAVVLVAVVGVPPGADASPGSAPVRLHVLRLVDRSRSAHFRDGTAGPRVFLIVVRYPTAGRPPFPLVVFAHGFALTPQTYARLLDRWAQAGYVVAAPGFPVEVATAPGGPDQSDLVNEPADISFVISRLVASTSPLRGLVDPARIAVAGHSDGAIAALSVAYDRRYRDRRIDAAMIMSGAPLPGFTAPPAVAPPLLAVQGTADALNRPGVTDAYFRLMHRPKFLLWLLGASHLPPYNTDDRWATVVDRTTTAFLDHYLRGAPLSSLLGVGTQRGVSRLEART